ncbi:Hypothetical predicted protein [Octopus vulgaris]|uniref:Trichoplein keratin filament-binding protein n=1 Tax=Octopus vulgaris TaxID=6645 RepID=A0AA36FNW8_OCTVU|nr:Hypothetical predicted protein [Octopus vulgaris]
MALPTLSSRSWPALQNIYMHTWNQRRCRDEDMRQSCLKTDRFFQTGRLKAEKIQKWTSDKYYRKSADDQREKMKKEAKEASLKARRVKLSTLLLHENKQYEAELKQQTPRKNYELLDQMKERVETLQSAREIKRKQLADEKLLEHWQKNAPEIQQVDRKLLTEHVVSEWDHQLEDAKKQAEEKAKEEETYRQQMEEEMKAAAKKEEMEQEKRIKQRKTLQEILKQQMGELKRKEEEAAELQEQQAKIEKEKYQMEVMENERRKVEERRKKQDFGRVLLRQHKTQMQCQARKVQKELEEDWKLLSMLVDREKELEQIETAKRQAALNDARWMKEVVEEQLKVEKLREAELDLLFEEEAARMWKKREKDWELEKQARENLMIEVNSSFLCLFFLSFCLLLL